MWRVSDFRSHASCYVSLLLLSILCMACRGVILPFSMAVPVAPSTPVPPPAEEVASAFLRAWEQRDYPAMYALLAPSSQATITEEEFASAYRSAGEAMTLTGLTARLRAVLQGESEAQADFSATAQTLLFGPLPITNTLTLSLEEGCWRVVWSPATILPQLEGGCHLYLLPDVPARGNIYDRLGRGLATNGCRVVVGVVPKKLEGEERTLSLLSEVLGKPIAALREEYADVPSYWFVPLGEISAEEGVKYHDMLVEQPGVVLREKPVRIYHEGTLAPHVLGYIGPVRAGEVDEWVAKGYPRDIVVGQAGLEAWGEEYLRGEWGGTLALVSANGQTLETLAHQAARQSRSLYTTLDRELQRKAVELLEGKRGAVVALDPRNGQVLAMASSPTFDLNLFAAGIAPEQWQALVNAPGQPLLNRAVQGQYPAASTFKIVSMAAAMESGTYEAASQFRCAGVWAGLGAAWTKRCWIYPRQHGVLDLKTGLTVSCDIVFYEVGKALYGVDPGLLSRYARGFGLGKPTEVLGLSAGEEAGGLVPDGEWKRGVLGQEWTVADSVHMAIGQGYLLVTPIQMAVLIGAVANGGTLYRPQLVWKVGGRPGVEDQYFGAEAVGKLPVSQEHLAAIREALRGVANQKRGTAYWIFRDCDIPVAGKTGTAENPSGAPHAWFIGYAPADEPQIAIAVVVENGGEGTVAAAPIFRALVEAFFQSADQEASSEDSSSSE